MKNIAWILTLLISLAAPASGLLCWGSDNYSIKGGDGRPWPWGSEVQIPWHNIQGVWKATGGSCTDEFIFKTKTDQNGEKMVQITQYDPVSCKVVARGLGYETNRYIYAQMVHQGRSYNLTIHAFSEQDVDDYKTDSRSLRSSESSGKVVVALTLFPLGKWEQRAAFEIVKVDPSTSMICK